MLITFQSILSADAAARHDFECECEAIVLRSELRQSEIRRKQYDANKRAIDTFLRNMRGEVVL